MPSCVSCPTAARDSLRRRPAILIEQDGRGRVDLQYTTCFGVFVGTVRHVPILYYSLYFFTSGTVSSDIIKNLSLAAPSPANLPKNLSLGKGIRSS